MAVNGEVPAPPQMPIPATYDFRHARMAPKGYKASRKRKLDEYQEQVAADEAEIAMRGDEQPSDVHSQVAKRAKYANRVSGKNWKAEAPRMSSTSRGTLSTSWEQKMKAKAEVALFKAQKAEARAEANSKLAAERERQKLTKERREANQKKALASTAQKITNNATLRRMMKSKKQRKQLVMAD